MNNFLKQLMTLATELNKAEGFNAVAVINEMELLYNKHIAELKNSATPVITTSNLSIKIDDITAIKREKITNETYREILDVEIHHNHDIIKDEDGTLRWKENPAVNQLLKNISLNDLCPLLHVLGYGKNSEVYRKLYRDMGYSLFGYWEVFYWEVNNEDADKYVPNAI